jgi:hypothetical protein
MADDNDLHQAALAAGAMVLGEDGTRQQYLFDLEQLRRLLAPVELPPCPVPLPAKIV